MKLEPKTPQPERSSSLPFDVSRIVSVDIASGCGRHLDVEHVRRYLASAKVVDEATVRTWSYAPLMLGSLGVGDDRSPLPIEIFYGGRARLTLEDGRSILIDGDATLLGE